MGSGTYPGFELGEAIIDGFLADFVIFAANNEVVVLGVCGGQMHVGVWVALVVNQAALDAAFWTGMVR